MGNEDIKLTWRKHHSSFVATGDDESSESISECISDLFVRDQGFGTEPYYVNISRKTIMPSDNIDEEARF